MDSLLALPIACLQISVRSHGKINVSRTESLTWSTLMHDANACSGMDLASFVESVFSFRIIASNCWTNWSLE